jgi:RimJ/RimL family protein N-acetyltransferase
MQMQLRTPRLLLRRWRAEDREPLAHINADPRVMEFFPAPLSREESDRQIERFERHFDEHGFGMWAVERRDAPGCIGRMGLLVATFPALFTPCVEIGWMLAAEHWGLGLATEGAREVLRYGFGILALDEIFSFTAVANARSRRVMEKIGLRHDPADDFDHPNLPEGHPLRRHVLYRSRREEWLRDSDT